MINTIKAFKTNETKSIGMNYHPISTNADVLDEEVRNALNAFKQAQQAMDYADPEFIESAILRVTAAETFLNELLKFKKRTTA